MTDMPCEAIQTNHCGSSLPELGHLGLLKPYCGKDYGRWRAPCAHVCGSLVTVDNYNHTHEHLFEFGVQHAEIANFTIQRLRNPAVSDGGHGRRVMIAGPMSLLESGTSIWSQSTFQTTRGSSPASSASTTRHIRQFGHPLITRQRTTVGPTEHLFKQFPEFPFTHTRQCATNRRTAKTRIATSDTGSQLDIDYGTRLHTANRSALDRVEIISHHAQHARSGDSERIGDGAQQFGAGFLLSTFDFGKVA